MSKYSTITSSVRSLLQQASADDPARAIPVLARGLVEIAEALEELGREVDSMP